MAESGTGNQNGDEGGKEPGHTEQPRTARSAFEDARKSVAEGVQKFVDGARERIGDDNLQRAEMEIKGAWESARDGMKDVGRKVGDPATRDAANRHARAAADAGVTVLHQVAVALRGLAEQVETALDERRTYHTDESVEAGVYACLRCGETVVMLGRKHLAPCASCQNARFRRKGGQ